MVERYKSPNCQVQGAINILLGGSDSDICREVVRVRAISLVNICVCVCVCVCVCMSQNSSPITFLNEYSIPFLLCHISLTPYLLNNYIFRKRSEKNKCSHSLSL